MKTSFRTVVPVAGAALLGIVALAASASMPAAAQQSGGGQAATTPTPAKPLPRTPWDGKPDMTGVWEGRLPAAGTPSAEERRSGAEELARLYQPWAKEKSDAMRYEDNPVLHCGPYGFPRYISQEISLPAARKAFYFLLQIVQTPKETDVLVEYIYSGYRVIPTDGSPHPKKIVPSFFGNSVGHWEGDTLVVDVIGFNGKIWLGGNLGNRPPGVGGGGSISSDALHEVERWRLVDADTLEYQVTVEDPKVLTGPWTTPKYLTTRAAPDAVIHEALCLDPEDLGVIKSNAAAKAKEEKK